MCPESICLTPSAEGGFGYDHGLQHSATTGRINALSCFRYFPDYALVPNLTML